MQTSISILKEVKPDGGTAGLNQKQIAADLSTEVPAINKQRTEGGATIYKMRIIQTEGERKLTGAVELNKPGR